MSSAFRPSSMKKKPRSIKVPVHRQLGPFWRDDHLYVKEYPKPVPGSDLFLDLESDFKTDIEILLGETHSTTVSTRPNHRRRSPRITHGQASIHALMIFFQHLRRVFDDTPFSPVEAQRLTWAFHNHLKIALLHAALYGNKELDSPLARWLRARVGALEKSRQNAPARKYPPSLFLEFEGLVSPGGITQPEAARKVLEDNGFDPEKCDSFVRVWRDRTPGRRRNKGK